MEPITTTVIVMYVAQKFLDQFLKEEGYNRIKKLFFPKKRYMNRLVQLIYQTVDEYEKTFPENLPEGKIAFYHSQIVFEKLTSVLLKTKLSAEFKFELRQNPNILIPSEEQLKCFMNIFANKIKFDIELRKLCIQENYQAEIFEISNALGRIEEKIDILLNRPYDNNILTTALTESYLKDLDYPSNLLQNYKPQQALEYLLQFKSNKWETSDDLIKYKVLANIGQCHLQLHNQDEAAKCFIDAEKYNPNSPNALGFFALGYALINNKEEFERVYTKAQELGDVSNLVYSSLIMLDKAQSSLETLLEKIPPKSQNDSQVAFAIARHLKKQENLEACLHWMQIAIDTDPKGRLELKGLLGCYILELVCSPEMFITRQVNIESREYIKRGIDLLTETWEGMTDNDLRKANFHMILNRGVGKKFLGDPQGAYTDIKEASNYNKDLVTLRHLAIASVESGRNEEAISVFEDIIKKSNEFSEEHEIEILLADSYIASNRSEDAISLIRSVIEKGRNHRRVNEARSLLIDIFINNNKLLDAKNENEVILQDFPENIIGYLNGAHIAKAEGNIDEITSCLREAWKRVNESTSLDEIHVLGNNAFIYNEYKIAIACFDKIVKLDTHSDIVKRLITSHYNLEQFKQASEICENLRKNGIYDAAIIDTEVNIYQMMSNAPKAIAVCEEFLLIEPENIPINTRAAFLYFQNMENVKCKAALLKIDNLTTLPLEVAFHVAKLHIELELYLEGLEYLYSLWRNNLNRAEVHNLYFTSLLQLPEEAQPFLIAETVKTGTAVTLKMNANIVTYFLVDKEPNITLGELNNSDSLAHKLIGKSIGDIIQIDDNMGVVKTAEITDVKSKFNFARNKSMDFIQSTFIENDGPRVITFEGDTDEEKGQSMFNMINRQVESTQQRDTQLIEFYKKGAFTIGLFSEAKSSNQIDIWTGVTNDEEMGVFATNCVTNEYVIAHNILEQERPIILDLTTILSLDALDALNKLDLLPNRRIVSQALIDGIRNYLLENKRIGSLGKMSVGKKGDQFIVHQITGEQITNQVNKIQKILDWLTEKCEVLPATEVINLDKETREEIFQLGGNISAESIFLTKEHDGLLLADEMTVRLIGWEKEKINGANVQMLFRSLMESKKITKPEYDAYSVNLIGMNYRGLMLESSTLTLALQKSSENMSQPFTTALAILQGNNSEENSAILVAVLFLKELFISSVVPSTRDSIVINTIETLAKYRVVTIVILKLKAFIDKEFNLLPVQKSELNLLIDTWQDNQ